MYSNNYSKFKKNQTGDTHEQSTADKKILIEKKSIASTAFLKEKKYWLKKYSGELGKCVFPYDCSPTIRETKISPVDSLKIDFDPSLFSRLMVLSKGSDYTLHILLTACVTVLLHKYTERQDIIIGTPIDKQEEEEGEFVNTVLPLRNQTEGHMTFKELLLQVRETISEAAENQNYPIETLLFDLKMEFSENHFPLFDVVILLENIQDERYIKHLYPGVMFSFIKNHATIHGRLIYKSDRYHPSSIKRMMEHFLNLMKMALFNIDVKLSGINILSENEKRQILFDFNRPCTAYPGPRTIHGLFAAQVEKKPGQIALIYNNSHLTYSQLDKQSAGWADVLKYKGVNPDDIVGIMVPRSIEMIVGTLAILKASAAYLPLDPEYPEERLSYMLKDSSVNVLITGKNPGIQPAFEGKISYIEDLPRKGGRVVNSGRTVINPDNRAYIIYTSGSTGNPKGVLVHHHSIVNTLRVRKEYYRFDTSDTVLQIPSFAFDSSVTDIFDPLVSGSRLLLIPPHHLLDLPFLNRYIPRNRVTYFIITPGLYKTFLNEIHAGLKGIKKITVAGDNVTSDLVKEHFLKLPHTAIYNEYGPSENSVNSTVYELKPHQTKVLVGKPMDNINCYILNSSKNLNPIGLVGELCLSGTGVSSGYLNNPGLTSQKFIPNPFLKGFRLYFTGDLGRWWADGNIEFVGRVDGQVKIRGFRVEMGEIETQLRRYEGITDAVVLDREDGNGNKYLCAYYVACREINAAELRGYLTQKLPHHMVPAFLTVIEKIPINPNGKLHRQALPDPDRFSGVVYVPPQNDLQQKLTDLWAGELGIEKDTISIDANFFDLGGDSLKATTLIAKIHKECKTQIPLIELFKTPTISGLAEIINQLAKNEYIAIEPKEKKEYHTLSSAQKRLYVLHQLDENSTAYNIPYVFLLEVNIYENKLEEIFYRVISRHESLRTSFEIVNEEPIQRIHPHVKFEPEYFNISTGDKIHQSSSIINLFIRPFNLFQAPLMRMGLIKIETGKHILIIDMHHIITDGISMNILTNEFMSVYSGRELPPLRFQYKDYSEWQSRTDVRDMISGQEKFWLKEFDGEIPILDLPTDYLRPQVQNFDGNILGFSLGKEISYVLKKLTLDEGVTSFLLILTIFNVLLSKLSGQEDIVVGIDIAGRNHVDLERIIGMFVNTLPLRNFPVPGMTFRQFLQEVKAKTLDVFENQNYPFEDLVNQLAVNRDFSRNPLFDVLFSFIDIQLKNNDDVIGESGNPDLKMNPYPYTSRISKFDLTLNVTESQEIFSFSFEYCTKLYKEETIKRFITYFKQIVLAVLHDRNQLIKGIEIITPEEKEQVLFEFNNTATSIIRDKCYSQLFEEQVAKQPCRIAAIFKGEHITYDELNKFANVISHCLLERGITTGSVGALYLQRSPAFLASIIGIFKAGAAYLPLELDYPAGRIEYILNNSQASIIIAGNNNLETLQSQQNSSTITTNILYLDQEKEKKILSIPKGHSTIPPRVTGHPDNLVYIIYTSGTTGIPKGVMIHQLGMLNHLYAKINDLCLTSEDIIAQTASACFDISVWQFLAGLLVGALSFIIEKETVLEPQLFLNTLQRGGITILESVPSLMTALLDSTSYETGNKLCRLRWMILTGETLRVPLVKKWFQFYPRIKLVNAYGPTEASDDITHHKIQESPSDDRATIPIGRPLQNLHIYILDKNLLLCPVGVKGEICVAGIGVGKGYWMDPEKTAKSFILNPFLEPIKDDDYAILYRTGDVGYFRADGTVAFLGRSDDQVKIRGNRIELGEIENRLVKYEGVKEAVVVAKEGCDRDQYLCAYIVTGKTNEKTPASGELREFLALTLPDYMIPSYFISLEKIPLAPNGKIDRKSLPEPEVAGTSGYIAPRNRIEKVLLDLWSETLGKNQLHVSQLRGSIGINDDFFELGGHSLMATILIARIHKTFEVQLPLVEFFKTSTIKGVAEYILHSAPNKFVSVSPLEKKEYYVLSSTQKRLYILHQFDVNSIAYNMANVLSIEGNIDTDKLEDIFKKLIARHESLRTSFETINGEQVQRIHDGVEFEIQYFDILPGKPDFNDNGALPGEIYNPQLEPIIIDIFIAPFNLAEAPLIRVGLKKIAKDRQILMIDMPHIVTDGISENILVSDFISFYAEQKLPPLRLQYKDYSLWQQSPEVQKTIINQEEYWLKVFQENAPVLNIPTDYPRPPVKSHEGMIVNFELTPENTIRLNEIARTQGATMFMVILTIYNIFLAKLSNQEDITVGCPIAGRRHTDLEKIIGVFINTLALRNYPSGEKTSNILLNEIKEKTIKAFGNQDYQLEYLVEKVAAQRDKSRNPLFDVSFSYQNFSDATVSNGKEQEEIKDLKIKTYNYDNMTSKFDLYLRAGVINERLTLSFEYCTKLFKKETILRFIQYFNIIVSSVIRFPGKKILEIEIMSEEEKNQVLYDFNATETGYPEDKLFGQLFEEQVYRTPDCIAVVGPSVNPINEAEANCQELSLKLSYRELNQRANHMANLLRVKNVKQGTIVGLMVKTSIEMVVGMIGILKAGGTFLPIEPGVLPERINLVLKDSNVKILLTQASLNDTFRANTDIININGTHPSSAQSQNPDNNKYNTRTNDPVYVAYTSGTEGKPKGVLVSHRNLVNYIYWFIKTIHLTSDDRSVLTSSFDFDALFAQLFSSLLVGCQLHLVAQETYWFAEGLLCYLKENKITYIKMTPHLFNFFVNAPEFSSEALRQFRLIILVGEDIKLNDVEKAYRLCPHLKVMSHYGFTETTIGSIAQFMDFDKLEQYKTTPVLGKPVYNTQLYVLNRGGHVVPGGVTAGLFVGGNGVGIGYLNNPDLTADKFIPALKGKNSNSYMYSTGDLARWLSDGTIQFVGRNDRQVTIRGYRVELGEIQNRLASHPHIMNAVVIDIERKTGEKIICAYIVELDAAANKDNDEPENPLNSGQLRNYLSKNLPDYMIPAHFVKIDKIPLTPSGKIDREALKKMDILQSSWGVYSPPTTDMEVKIAGIWAEVLNMDKISINDDFFELGGNSLTMITLTSRIRELGCPISLPEVMSNLTINELAAVIDRKNTPREAGEDIYETHLLSRLDCIEKLNESREPRNIFIIHPRSGMVTIYREWAELVEKKFKVYGLQARGLKSGWKMEEKPEQLIGNYVEQILAIQKTGPFIIAGYCVGSVMSYEITRMLESMNHQVEKLIMFDTHGFFLDKKVEFLRKLETLPGIFKKVLHFQNRRAFRKALRAANLSETGGSEPMELVEKYLDTISPYILSLEFVKAPILVPLAVNTDRRRATKENFDKMTKSESTMIRTPGDHESIWEKPNVDILAEIILNNV